MLKFDWAQRPGLWINNFKPCPIALMRELRFGVRGGPPVPSFRGLFHVFLFWFSLITTGPILLFLPNGLSRAAAGLSFTHKTFLYLTSAIAHTTEFVNLRLLDRVFQVDKANIFVAMAIDFTCIYTVKASVSDIRNYSIWPEMALWLACGTVALICVLPKALNDKLILMSLSVLQVLIMVGSISMADFTTREIINILAIFIVGILGGICWAIEYPNPIPGIIESHEILHIATIIMHLIYIFLLFDMANK